MIFYCRRTKYIALFAGKSLIYGIASWLREKHISCTISRYWKMKGSIGYVSILTSYCLLVLHPWSCKLLLNFAYNFKSIKDIVSGNFIPDLLIGMTNIITVLFLFRKISYDFHTNCILYIMSLRLDWCRWECEN